MCIALHACAAERAVRVTLQLQTPVDDVCVLAREEGPPPSVVFASPYAASALPSPATLTFVAAGGHSGLVDITARGVTAGTFLVGSTIVTPLSVQGTTEATLRVDRCRARSAAGFGTRSGGTFAALHDPPRLIAADWNADGRDELLAVAADGSLAVLDAASVDQGSHRESELLAPDGSLAGSGDLDRDCRLDVLVAAGSGALVIASESGASPAPVGSAPHDVAIGRLTRTGTLSLVTAGAGGLALVPPPGATGMVTSVSTTPFDHVVAWDADNDGGTELAASGAMGAMLFATAGGHETDATSTLPMGFAMLRGPIAIGDVNDDGALDLVLADTDTLHVATRSGAGWRDGSGTTPATVDAAVARLWVADVDGDCAEDVITLSTAGVVTVLRFGASGGLTMRGMQSGVLDAAVGDFDADGAREIALLGTGGRITLWQL